MPMLPTLSKLPLTTHKKKTKQIASKTAFPSVTSFPWLGWWVAIAMTTQSSAHWPRQAHAVERPPYNKRTLYRAATLFAAFGIRNFSPIFTINLPHNWAEQHRGMIWGSVARSAQRMGLGCRSNGMRKRSKCPKTGTGGMAGYRPWLKGEDRQGRMK